MGARRGVRIPGLHGAEQRVQRADELRDPGRRGRHGARGAPSGTGVRCPPHAADEQRSGPRRARVLQAPRGDSGEAHPRLRARPGEQDQRRARELRRDPRQAHWSGPRPLGVRDAPRHPPRFGRVRRGRGRAGRAVRRIQAQARPRRGEQRESHVPLRHVPRRRRARRRVQAGLDRRQDRDGVRRGRRLRHRQRRHGAQPASPGGHKGPAGRRRGQDRDGYRADLGCGQGHPSRTERQFQETRAAQGLHVVLRGPPRGKPRQADREGSRTRRPYGVPLPL